MAIRLRDGSYTRTPAVDYRLRRLVQVTADIARKPIDQCRVLDLACLEGHSGALRAGRCPQPESRDIRHVRRRGLLGPPVSPARARRAGPAAGHAPLLLGPLDRRHVRLALGTPEEDAIKPALRAVHILPPDSTPEFQRKR